MTNTALLTDKYELTMLQAAMRDGLHEKKAVFELFARKLPQNRRYGVVAGTERALRAIKDFHFNEDAIAFLGTTGLDETTLAYLADYRFTGSVRGYREGDLYFPYSPVLQIESTFGEAVVLETILLSIFNHDSAIASAASRMVHAAQGIPLLEMGSRRVHENSAVDAARAAYLAGFAGTSNLEAGRAYTLPTIGTSAHAFTLAHRDEKEAFARQVEALGVSTTLLVDTYDIKEGIDNAIAVAGTELGGVRIDSGDFYEEAVNARAQLDALGATKTKIVLSSDIDEYVIDEVVERRAPVDSIGVGTRVATGSGHPTASMVYKLVEIEDERGNMVPVAKKSSGKKSIGGAKSAYRRYSKHGIAEAEIVQPRTAPAPQDALSALLVDYAVDGNWRYLTGVVAARGVHELRMNTLLPEQKTIQAGEPAIPTLTEGE